ncbi:FkbM family methyltransferase [Streptomyces sp. CHA1]|uniref:FkbM family methyltransferase n=1 Tax=unclassified Streptomyces TaxID=2593676 RepID=UPI001BFC0368|nr:MULTISPECIES: FkbM family methyltransferase [unclassified Streptomyces]MBT3160152.1 FkbM family methyltransferase [Streptomyces sp. G11C]MCO6704296.1 FkbM family methyltransferase [Streptomyces sp. CHB9.2]MCO6710566.1 FkbM family methyltransferase [Streptomyces sp. CHA3]MCO6716366.1 FkbM family methyltransferase [Streptomyces sp. CHB19.2]MCO6722497.1 FkbM family methyltransferase [Streptomyces sp. Vc714c-19]
MSTSPLARALRAYVRYAPGTVGKARLVGSFLDEHLRTHSVHTTVRLLTGDKADVTTSDVIQRYQYLFGEWEPNLSAFLRDRLRPGDTFIDVGAHRGAFSLLASHAVDPDGRVVAIEPSPQFHADLTAAATTNQRANIRAVRAAASDTHGTLALYLEDPANLGHTTAVQPNHVHTAFEVQTAPLADLISRAELATTRIIKIDVEGVEAAAIRGLLPALTHLRDDAELVVEVTPRLLAKQGESAAEIIDTLREHGFHAYTLTNDYDPATYPRTMHRPEPPVRCTETPKRMTDLVFSRTDADSLTLGG